MPRNNDADEQVPVSPAARAEEIVSDGIHEVRPDLGYQRLAIANVVYVGPTVIGSSRWVLVDAGIMGSAPAILRAAEDRFGDAEPPAAIIMTHGHFDHVGALRTLADGWQVPIYAHPVEMPYLSGDASYPPADPTVGGGMMAALSRFYPRGPVDVREWLQPLPEDGSVPEMPGWRWIHTPGHTRGHISLWDEAGRTIIAGDAFVTTRQESAYAVAVQKPEIHGPPQYFTEDWVAAAESVRRLAALEPELVVTGHGRALQGAEMRSALHLLASDFERIAVPHQSG